MALTGNSLKNSGREQITVNIAKTDVNHGKLDVSIASNVVLNFLRCSEIDNLEERKIKKRVNNKDRGTFRRVQKASRNHNHHATKEHKTHLETSPTESTAFSILKISCSMV